MSGGAQALYCPLDRTAGRKRVLGKPAVVSDAELLQVVTDIRQYVGQRPLVDELISPVAQQGLGTPDKGIDVGPIELTRIEVRNISISFLAFVTMMIALALMIQPRIHGISTFKVPRTKVSMRIATSSCPWLSTARFHIIGNWMWTPD